MVSTSNPMQPSLPKNHHAIETRSKSGISKPKSILSLSILHTESDLTSFSQSVKYDHQCHAMTEKVTAHTPATHVSDL